MRRGTLAFSWGRWGGAYVHRHRVCLGWLAVTHVPVEVEELMRAYADQTEPAGGLDVADLAVAECIVRDLAAAVYEELTTSDGRSVDVVRPELRTRAWWMIGRDDDANYARWLEQQ